jgi:hypothetical protein
MTGGVCFLCHRCQRGRRKDIVAEIARMQKVAINVKGGDCWQIVGKLFGVLSVLSLMSTVNGREREGMSWVVDSLKKRSGPSIRGMSWVIDQTRERVQKSGNRRKEVI